MKFYRNKECGKVATINFSKDGSGFCSDKWEELVGNTTDGAKEKHVPVATVDGNTVVVNVGSVDHPMAEEHFITFIALETEKTEQIVYLKPVEKPAATFALAADDKAVAVYEYCNLHGLWKTVL